MSLRKYTIPYYDVSNGQLLGTWVGAAPDSTITPNSYTTEYGYNETLSDGFDYLGTKYCPLLICSPTHLSISQTDAIAALNENGLSGYIDAYNLVGKTVDFVYNDEPNNKLALRCSFTLGLDQNERKQVNGSFYFYKNGQQVGGYPSTFPILTTTYGTVVASEEITVNFCSVPIVNFVNPTNNYPFLIYSGGVFWRRRNTGPGVYVTEHRFNLQYSSLFAYSTYFNQWIGDWQPPEYDDKNPYEDLVDDNNKGGADTNFSDDSDTVSEDSMPTISAVGTGFATLFTPTRAQLRSLSEIFWNSNFFTAMQNLVENITGMFTSLAMVPFTVPAGSTVEVTWLGMAITEVYLTLAAQQYIEFDMGSINLGGDDRIFCYDNCLDYSPFSTLGIYLPFIGYQQLDIDECRKHTIHLTYRIDIMSGACVALISVAGNTIYQFTGNCLTQIPITNESIQSLISDAVNVGIAATQAHAARSAVGAAESALSEAESSYKANPTKGNSGVKSAEGHLERSENHLLQTRSSLASASANAAMGLKPQFNKTGSVSAAASMLSVRQPYLFLTTPRMSMPHFYEHYAGFPSNITGKLNTFSGFTVVESIRLNDLVATAPEVAEIYDLLHSGVII